MNILFDTTFAVMRNTACFVSTCISWSDKITNYLYKGTQLTQASMDLYRTLCEDEISPSQKVHRVITDIFVLVFQAAEIGADVKNASLDTKLAIKVSLCGTDFAKELSKKSIKKEPLSKEDYLDLFVVAGNRIADLRDFRATHCADCCSGSITDTILSSVGIAGRIAAKRKDIQLAYDALMRWKQNAIGTLEGNRQAYAYIPLQNVQIDNANEQDENLELDEEYLQELRIIQRAQSLRDLTFIPQLFAEDAVLAQWRCPIMHKPIRYVVVVKGTQENAQPILYEQSNITEWINNNSQQLPLGWPEDVELTLENLANYNPIQFLIDNRLQHLLNDPHVREFIGQVIGNVNANEGKE